MSPSGKVRLNLMIAEALREKLEGLLDLSEAESVTEVIRRAVGTYDLLLRSVRKEGAKVIIRASDGSEREIVFT